MSYRNLLVYVDRGVESDERVSLAIDLACRLDARLIGLSGSVPEADLSGADAGGAMVGEALTLLRDCAFSDVKAARTRFSELTNFCADRTEWRGEVGFPADLIARAARAADLVIVGRNHERSPYHNLDPADALMAIDRSAGAGATARPTSSPGRRRRRRGLEGYGSGPARSDRRPAVVKTSGRG